MDCGCEGCQERSTYVFWKVGARQVNSETHLCELHGRQCFEDFWSQARVERSARRATSSRIRVDVKMVIYHTSPEETACCCYLHELDGPRRFWTTVNLPDYPPLIAALRHESAPRPRTHTAWASTISQLGGELLEVDLDMPVDSDGWFEAQLHIRKDGTVRTVVTRPIDAYILAVVCAAPIYVVESSLERLTGDASKSHDQ